MAVKKHKSNPLQKYFRSPGIFVKVPTLCQYLNDITTIETTVNDEFAVYPMTSADEIIMKNPEALLNGFAIEQVISSCVPGIKNIREFANIDLDVLLLSIKKATYGDILTTHSTCPVCKKENEFEISIDWILANIKYYPKDFTYRINDNMVFYFKPYSFEVHSKIGIKQYEEGKLAKSLMSDDNMSELEKIREFQKSFLRIAEFNVEIMSGSIMKIVVEGEVVDDPDFILEYVKNADRNVIEKLNEKSKEINEYGGMTKKLDVVCTGCQHAWESDLILDPSYFFG